MQNDKLVKLDTTCNETGFVIKKYENSPKVGAYIPSLMPDIDMKKGPWEQRVTSAKSSILKNDNNFFRFDPITICNYYDIDQRDNAIYYVDKELGEKIRIKYEDNDIKKAFFFDEDYKMTDSLMEKIEEMEEILEIHEENFKIIKNDLVNKDNRIKELQTEDISLQGQLKVKDNQVDNLQNQLRIKDAEIADLQSQLNTKTNQINTLTIEINNLKGQIVQNEEDIDQLQRQINHVLNLISQIRNEKE